MTVRTIVKVPIQKNKETEFVSFDFDGHHREDIAILFKGWKEQAAPLVRIHSECLTGDVFGSRRCDCNSQLHHAIDLMSAKGGIILYLRQEGRDIGLYNKLQAYELQHSLGLDTFAANEQLGFPRDARNYKIAAQMLKDLGVTNIRLLTNNPEKQKSLQENGIKIEERISTGLFDNEDNVTYLDTKKRYGHLF